MREEQGECSGWELVGWGACFMGAYVDEGKYNNSDRGARKQA